MHDAVIISDLHLGTPVCRIGRLHAWLDDLPAYKQLILLGDVLDSTHRCLPSAHGAFLERLKVEAQYREVIWVAGNHDRDAEQVAADHGILFVHEVVLGDIILVHGDCFDDFLVRRPVLVWCADTIYALAQRVHAPWAMALKAWSKTYAHCVAHQRERAIRYCAHRGCSRIVCGHTHRAVRDGVYNNAGCWTDDAPSTWLSITAGEIRLHEAGDGE